MAAVPQSASSRRDRFWQGVQTLQPLQGFFAWVFRLLAICATFAIVVCSVIIGIELAAHDAFQTGWLYNLAIVTQDVLNAAIEGAMLGCIALAKQAKEEGDTAQKHRMFTMGIVFLLLTVTTIGFQVFKASEDMAQGLLFVRCSAGLAYCVISHYWGKHEGIVVPAQVQDRLEALFQNAQHNLHATIDPQNIAKAIVPLLPVPEPPVQVIDQSQIDLKPVRLSGLKTGLIKDFKATQKWLQMTDVSGSESTQISGSEVAPSPQKKGAESHSESIQTSGSESTPVSAPEPPKPVAPSPLKKPARATQKATKSGSESTQTSDPKSTQKATTVPTQGQPEARLEAAAQVLREKGQRLSGRALAALAHVNRDTANKWLQVHPESGSESTQISGSEADKKATFDGSEATSKSGSEATKTGGSESTQKASQSHPEINETSGSESTATEEKDSHTEPLPTIILGGSEASEKVRREPVAIKIGEV